MKKLVWFVIVLAVIALTGCKWMETLPGSDYSLSVNVTGSGTVSREPDETEYAEGSSVVLTAIPEAGWGFSGWQGDLTGATNPVTLIMDSDRTVTAVFEVLLSSAKEITSFIFETAQNANLPIDLEGAIEGSDVYISLPAGTDVMALVPTITISPAATIDPLGGIAQDFTNPVNYTVTAENGSTKVFSVSAEVFSANCAASEDAHVVSNEISGNFGSTSSLYVGGTTMNGYTYRSYIKFDLAGLAAVSEIDNAILWIYMIGQNGWIADKDFRFALVLSSWDESTITWGTQPTSGEPLVTIPGNQFQEAYIWHGINATAFVKAWHTGESANNGILIESDDNYGYPYFNSSEATSFKPYLEVMYHN
ncbi:MAG: DNRLRE domain-containing protein [Spirochaetales bacterium]|nr:DNRLRE domain-containing protein [Spirochaetales bacterium]